MGEALKVYNIEVNAEEVAVFVSPKIVLALRLNMYRRCHHDRD